jgi:hypothetical protein
MDFPFQTACGALCLPKSDKLVDETVLATTMESLRAEKGLEQQASVRTRTICKGVYGQHDWYLLEDCLHRSALMPNSSQGRKVLQICHESKSYTEPTGLAVSQPM